MNFFSVSASSTSPSEWVRMNTVGYPRHTYTLTVDFNGATATADVEFAIEKDLTSPEAITHDVLTGITGTTTSDLYSPVSAFRLNLSAYTSGTVTLKIVQA